MPKSLKDATWIVVLLLAGFSTTRLFAAPTDNKPSQPQSPTSTADLLAQAEHAQAQQQWDRAAASYLQLIFAGNHSPEIRKKLRLSLRRASQMERHLDLAFQQYVVSLELSESLNLYQDVLVSLEKSYADHNQASVSRMFAHGLKEFEIALDNPRFRKLHITNPNPKWEEFRQRLYQVSQATPMKPSQARQRLLEVVPLSQQYLGIKNGSAVVFEFLCGACSGLDEYTVYLIPDKSRRSFASAVLDLASYGLLVGVEGEHIVVQGIVPNSFIEWNRPQVRTGDRLIRVNGRAIRSSNQDVLTEALAAPMSDRHELELSPSQGDMSLRIDLPVPAPSVLRTELLRESVGYIRIGAFRDNLLQELDQALTQIRDKGFALRGLILDLRANPGGQFRMGVQLAERFQPHGILVTTQGQLPEFRDRVFSSVSGPMAIDLPLVVLVDARTMSTAEIVAAALKGHGRAQIVGVPTFGKGLVQCPIRLPILEVPSASERGTLIVSIARVYGPNREVIHQVGVMPHIIEADPDKQLLIALDRLMMLPPMMK